MTTIISPGRTVEKAVRFTCAQCDCVFECAMHVEAKLNFDQRDGNYWSANCPNSGCKGKCTKDAGKPNYYTDKG